VVTAIAPHWISKCLIEKLSPHCSIATFNALETVLFEYSTEYERSEQGAHLRGHSSFTLLSSLAPERRSTRTIERLVELEAKFLEPDGPPQGIRCYTIISPIAEEAAKDLSDNEWLAMIEKFRGLRRSGDRKHPEIGGEQELAGMMLTFVKSEPERFAKLSLRFPADVYSGYLMNVLYGLKDVAVAPSLRLDVARKAFDLEDPACLKAAVGLLGTIDDEFLPLDAIAFLARLATQHLDPQRELWRAEKEGEVAYFNGDVYTCGLNTVRGYTAEVMRNLIAHRPALCRHISRDHQMSRPRRKHFGARVRCFDFTGRRSPRRAARAGTIQHALGNRRLPPCDELRRGIHPVLSG
jgi:hypothetical protein